MADKTSEASHERERSNQAVEPFDDRSADEFEVTIAADESGDPDRFHITSISARPRQ